MTHATKSSAHPNADSELMAMMDEIAGSDVLSAEREGRAMAVIGGGTIRHTSHCSESFIQRVRENDPDASQWTDAMYDLPLPNGCVRVCLQDDFCDELDGLLSSGKVLYELPVHGFRLIVGTHSEGKVTLFIENALHGDAHIIVSTPLTQSEWAARMGA